MSTFDVDTFDVDTFDLEKEVEQFRDLIYETRRKYHRCPELALHEFKTTEMIAAELDEMGIPYDRFEPTGLVGYLGRYKEMGAPGVHTVALRADIDGLRVEEQTGLPFASEIPGQMHACGHDGHITGLLGAARILKKYESYIDGCVKLIFEPSEETGTGSTHIIKQGALDHVEEIFGVHIFSDIPAGKVSFEAGPRMAATDHFTIHIHGKSGHAAKPNECADATVAAAALAMNLQTIVSRSLNPIENAVLTIGRLQSGTAYNVVSGEAVLEGTVRTFSVDVEEMIRSRMVEVAKSTATVFGCTAEVDYPKSAHGPLINDAEIAVRVKKAASRYFSEEALSYVPMIMLGESFANYLDYIPGAFAFIGGGKPNQVNYLNHHNKFDYDDEALINAVKAHIIYIVCTIMKISTD